MFGGADGTPEPGLTCPTPPFWGWLRSNLACVVGSAPTVLVSICGGPGGPFFPPPFPPLGGPLGHAWYRRSSGCL